MFSLENNSGSTLKRDRFFTFPTSRDKNITSSRNKRYQSLIIVGAVISAILIYFLPTPRRTYRPPLNIPTEIAGSFGEVRKDHFHLGIDIRTDGIENMPVYAMADGYIYRAGIHRDGYGKALYIAYNNGLMSVYAHLNSFSEEVSAAVTIQQLLSEQWEQEMFFTPNRFPVKKGALVGYSGNSGSSDGPHLHLEIRNSKTKAILNPVLFGINSSDNTAPSIRSIMLYQGNQSLYEGSGTEIRFNTERLLEKDKPVIVTDSVVKIGIEANDKNEQSKFRLGIYRAQLFLDNKLHFEFIMDSIPIAKEKYVNATIDYSQWFHHKRIIQLLFRLPGNHLPAYEQFKENGFLRLTDDRNHQITIIVKDASGNTKRVDFHIRYKRQGSNRRRSTDLLIPGMPHKVSKGSVVAYFSPHAFYDAVPFTIKEIESEFAGSVSKSVKVYDPAVPVHTRYKIQLKTNLKKNDPARNYVLMEINNGKDKNYVKGNWNGDYMEGSFDRFGTIRLIVDNIPPRISPVEQIQPFNYGEIIRLLCSDNTGYVENFTARIDGQWQPFEQKKNSFHFLITRALKKGNHCLDIEISDQAGNLTRKKLDFIIR